MNCYRLTFLGPRWALTRDSDSFILREFRTRWQAIDETRGILEGESCSLIIHGIDGTVEAVRTYSESDNPSGTFRARNAIRPRPLAPVIRRRPAKDGGVRRARV